MRIVRLLALAAVAPFVGLAAASCDGNDGAGEPCADSVDTSCAPLYEPTYAQVFARTLQPTCALAGGSCHASTGRQGGLVFEDADAAYDLLTGSRPRVKPGDPRCSVLVARISSTDAAFRMPPGAKPLDPSERCSIIRWIADGARR